MRLNVPLTGEEELFAIGEVLNSGYLTQGPKVVEFEELVAKFVGTTFSFATSSATTGIHLALHAAGVLPGDEVIIPDFSFPATANAIIQQGAIPIFVDIDLATYNMNPALIEDAITPRTRAIMPVHAFGLPADMNPINEIASRYGLPVIEDAACALGGMYQGRPAGSLGTAGVFSFHPRKIITTGEGGMVTTSDETVADRIRVLRTHGSVRGDRFMSFIDAGYNYRLSDILGAIGFVQMSRLSYIIARRQELSLHYKKLLDSVEGLQAPIAPEGSQHAFQSFVVLLDDVIDRDAVIDEMARDGIETTLGTYSMHLQPYFRERFGISDAMLPMATRAHKSALTLPLYPQLEFDDLSRVCDSLRRAMSAQS